MSLDRELIDVDDSVLLVIDVQDRFLEKFSETDQEVLKNRRKASEGHARVQQDDIWIGCR